MKDTDYMRRAIDLAKLGLGRVSPNPMVGCVIVHQNRIIGEGYHQVYGGPHAEVNAINTVREPLLLPESTIFVTLEPCSHFGKTPPCADLLIEKKVGKVVVAIEDPFPQVAGSGIAKLRAAGIEVEVGLLAEEAAKMNVRFLRSVMSDRPYIILKWAQTADGFIARKDGSSKWISSDLSRQLVHKWRSEEDGILVGKHTALVDDPMLNTRDWTGKDPKRILLDSSLRLPSDANLYSTDQPTIVFNAHVEKEDGQTRWIIADPHHLEPILKKLKEERIQSLIVEGGAQVLQSFIATDCWDEARVFTSVKKFGDGISAPVLDKNFSFSYPLENDRLSILYNHT